MGDGRKAERYAGVRPPVYRSPVIASPLPSSLPVPMILALLLSLLGAWLIRPAHREWGRRLGNRPSSLVVLAGLLWIPLSRMLITSRLILPPWAMVKFFAPLALLSVSALVARWVGSRRLDRHRISWSLTAALAGLGAGHAIAHQLDAVRHR